MGLNLSEQRATIISKVNGAHREMRLCSGQLIKMAVWLLSHFVILYSWPSTYPYIRKIRKKI